MFTPEEETSQVSVDTQSPVIAEREKRPLELSSGSLNRSAPVSKKPYVEDIPVCNLVEMSTEDTTIAPQSPPQTGSDQTMNLILRHLTELSEQAKQNKTQLAKLAKLDNIEGKLDNMNVEMRTMKGTINELQSSLESVNGKLSKASEKIEVLTTKTKRIDSLEREVGLLKESNKELEERVIQLDSYSRRENILIDGLEETESEDCEAEIQTMFANKLDLNSIAIQRCHRLGKKKRGDKPRRIIVRLVLYKDKERIMKRTSRLEGSDIYINHDFPMQVERERAELRPFLRLAKKIDESSRFVQNKLRFQGRLYTKDTVQDMNINMDDLGMRFTEEHVFFAGQHAVLSNWYPCAITYGGQTFASAEHLYQHRKCIALQRPDLALKVLEAATPYNAMLVGKETKEDGDWISRTGYPIMKEVVAAKLQQAPRMKETLQKHAGKSFVEATRNSIWGAGIPLTGKEVTTQWRGKNLFGEILTNLARGLGNENPFVAPS